MKNMKKCSFSGWTKKYKIVIWIGWNSKWDTMGECFNFVLLCGWAEAFLVDLVWYFGFVWGKFVLTINCLVGFGIYKVFRELLRRRNCSNLVGYNFFGT